MRNGLKFVFAILLGSALALPALAEERRGSTTVKIDGEQGAQSSFQMKIDPATGAFERSGEVSLRNGRRITYRIEGRCTPEKICQFKGTGRGPYGGSWSGEGELRPAGNDERLLSLDLTSPIGTHVVVEHRVSGIMLPR